MMTSTQVVVIKGRGVLSPSGEVNQKKLLRMYNRGFQILTGQQSLREGLGYLFNPRERIGIKINTIGGRKLSSRPEVALSLANLLVESGLQEKNIIIWDRTNR